MSGASVDAIVIGAGAGGGIVAAELARAGLRVSLLDRGRNFSAAADADDNGSQALYNQTGVQRFGPDATEFQTFRGDPGTPASKVCADDYRFSIVGWCVGGGTVSYQGLSWRFHPQTFRLKSLYGPIAGSTVEDWPITYDDLEPYYEKAEYELGICGEASPVGPPRRKPYPMPPLDDDREAQLLFPAARRWPLRRKSTEDGPDVSAVAIAMASCAVWTPSLRPRSPSFRKRSRRACARCILRLSSARSPWTGAAAPMA